MPMARCARGYSAKLMGSSNHSATAYCPRSPATLKDTSRRSTRQSANGRMRPHSRLGLPATWSGRRRSGKRSSSDINRRIGAPALAFSRISTRAMGVDAGLAGAHPAAMARGASRLRVPAGHVRLWPRGIRRVRQGRGVRSACRRDQPGRCVVGAFGGACAGDDRATRGRHRMDRGAGGRLVHGQQLPLPSALASLPVSSRARRFAQVLEIYDAQIVSDIHSGFLPGHLQRLVVALAAGDVRR